MHSKKINLSLTKRDVYAEVTNTLRDSVICGLNKYLKWTPGADIPDVDRAAEVVMTYIGTDLTELIDWEKSK